MVIISPRPYFISIANYALVNSREYIMRSIPTGATWKLKYILANYQRTVVAGNQSSPELFYRVYDADGRAFQMDPVLLPQTTSPAGQPRLDATNPLDIIYGGGSNIKIEITGQNGTLPSSVSLTLVGLRGWERFGK